MTTLHKVILQTFFGSPAKALSVCLLFIIVLSSCKTKETAKPVIYEGPLREAENILMNYTENDRMKAILKAKKIFDYQNGDQEFPEGIYLEFFDKTGKLTSTLRANTAFYFKGENRWRGRGKVVVKNIEKGQQLNTEELFWKPDTKKIFTEKFVTITDEHDVLYGTGLDAFEDMSSYTIKNPTGTIEVKDN
ncbi:MAG: LPS export ABC transporter periplasmic protein LptC [Cyclobacteriaceae bacterium]|jgi:LPS export ABC transporter protein LptC|nr:LPS export ABC transporter periplasmic protein LptC [Cyclobacteriaceae bacterium]